MKAKISEDSAIVIANTDYGFQEIKGYDYLQKYSINAKIIQLDTTSYFNKWINNRKVWHIVYHDVPSRLPSKNDEYDLNNVYDVNLYIDSETGKLLKIWAAFRTGSYKVPGGDIYEGRGFKYIGLPDSVMLPFSEIELPNEYYNSISMEAFYVCDSSSEDDGCVPVWHIILHGYLHTVYPPAPDEGKPQEPAYKLVGRMDLVVDGKSGIPIIQGIIGIPPK